MPTSTSRGRYNSACPAALRVGRPGPLVVAGLDEDTTVLGRVFIVVCTGGTTVGVVGFGTGTTGVVVGIGTGGTVGVVGIGTGGTVGVVGIGAGGSVAVGGGGTLIVVGPPTGPEQIFPLSQHPMMPLLARAQ